MISMLNDNVIPQPALSIRQIREGLAKRSLAVRGMAEAVTYSFLSSQDAILFGGGAEELRLNNPISAELDAMRPSVLPNLISAVGRNSNMGSNDLAIFEVGPQYSDVTPAGEQMVAGAIRSGNTGARDWAKATRPVDLFDIKADALFVLESLSAPTNNLQVDPSGAPGWYLSLIHI